MSKRTMGGYSNMILSWETQIDTRLAPPTRSHLLTLQPLSPMHKFSEVNLDTMRTDDMNNAWQV